MITSTNIKLTLLAAFIFLAGIWLASGTISNAVGRASAKDGETLSSVGLAPAAGDDYVGSETCRACHEQQFDKVANTKHGKLGTLDAWKGKVVGCESCHGPGKAHVEGSGDKSKIKVFKTMDSKAVSETCLACHAGKESHNNFRRGEHWRNNVGCTDCHSAHGSDSADFNGTSNVFAGDISARNLSQATHAMLKSPEQQLCISCHKETKSQFSKPFHHKVLEGTMSCSDCHNPHGGFETKQTKLAVGADAACIKCHSNKQGPFVFEHGPLKLEGCTACHTPHGSSNSKLLKRSQVRQLCFECHAGITEELSPGVPSRHNQAQMREQQCTVCHSAIHGSNSSRLFFR